jgi:NADPH-dependent curcumin reductase CurA
MKRLRIEGFFVPDHFGRAEEFIPPLRAWHDEGRLVSRFDETPGLENTLAAYARMLGGGAIGKVLVKLA